MIDFRGWQIAWWSPIIRAHVERYSADYLHRLLVHSQLSTAAGNALLQLLLENADWTGIGDAGGLRGSVTAGSFYIGLNTASPGVGGNQTTNEISYTGYARVAVARSTSGWTATGLSSVNDAAITFGQMTGGTGGTVTHSHLGTGSSGTGALVLFDAVDASVAVATNSIPEFTAGALTVTAA